MKTLMKYDATRAAALMNQFPNDAGVASEVVLRLAMVDPMAAVLKARESPIEFRFLMPLILPSWMHSAPDEALAYLHELPDRDESVRWTKEALQQLGRLDPYRAGTYALEAMPPGKERFALIASLGDPHLTANSKDEVKAIEKALTEVREWRRSLPPGPEQQAVLMVKARKLAENDPGALFDFLDEIGWQNAVSNPAAGVRSFYEGGSSGDSSAAGELGSALFNAIAEIAKEDPREALRRVAQIPSDDRRSTAAHRVTNEWFRQDPDVFLDWVNTDMPEEVASKFAELLPSGIDEVEWLDQHLSKIDSETTRSMFAAEVSDNLQTQARKDPLRALQIAEQSEYLSERDLQRVINEVVPKLVKDHLAEALVHYSKLTRRTRARTAAPIIESLAENKGAEQAIQWFAELPQSDRGPAAHRSVTEVWFELDSQGASEWVGKLPQGQGRDYAVQVLVNGLTETNNPDFPAAALWATTVDSQDDRNDQLAGVYRLWLKHDREEAVATMEASGLPKESIDRLLEATPNPIGMEPAEALQSVSNMKNGVWRETILGQLAKYVVKDSPDAALEALRLGGRPEHAQDVFRSWGEHDFDAAAAAALDLPGKEFQGHAAYGLLQSLHELKSKVSEEWITPLTDLAAASGHNLYIPIETLSKLSPSAIRDLTQKHGEKVEDSVRAAIEALSVANPARGIEFADALASIGTDSKGALVGKAIAHWAQSDPNAAIAWVEKLPAGTRRDMGYQNVAHNWARIDPSAAEHWLETLPPSTARDLAVRGFVEVQARRDSKTAVQLAGTIQDETARSMALRVAYEGWIQTDYETAASTVDVEQLPRGAQSYVKTLLKKEAAWHQLRQR